mgnify:FL=1
MQAEVVTKAKNAKLKAQSVRLEPRSIEKLKNMEIEMWGVQLKTYQDKIDHLMWFYSSHINNNWNKKKCM